AEFVHQVDENVVQLALNQELADVVERALHNDLIDILSVLRLRQKAYTARREDANAHYHSAFVRFANQPLQARSDVWLQPAVEIEAIPCAPLHGPAGIASL